MSDARFLIRKNGYFYRPDSAGYTTSKADAGRYTMEEAHKITHPNGQNGPRDGMSYIAEHLWPQGPTPQITLSAAMQLPEVRALVEAATEFANAAMSGSDLGWPLVNLDEALVAAKGATP